MNGMETLEVNEYKGMTRYEAIKHEYDTLVKSGQEMKCKSDELFGKAEQLRLKLEHMSIEEAQEVL